MTIFDQNGTAENRNFGRIWMPKPQKRKKTTKKIPQKRERKKVFFKKKKGQKRYPLKADFAIFYNRTADQLADEERNCHR